MSAQLAFVVVLSVLAGAALGAFLVYGVALSVRKNQEAESSAAREELKGQFASLSADTLKNATDQFLKLAESRLDGERAKAASDLDQRRRDVQNSVDRLVEQLEKYEGLVREFEADRDRKFGSLSEQIPQLRSTIDRFRSILTDSRARGQWGERMAEDILRLAGLQEGVQYVYNRAQETSSSRPDFTFFLPDGHKLNMDVKFPLNNFARLQSADSDDERERAKNDFLKDVRARMREVQKKDYINPDEQTLDYVLLFIPNEHVYGFVLDSQPDIIDEALKGKVILVSPFSLYAVLSIVRQAFDNFHFSRRTQDVFKSVASFLQTYEKFQERFAKLGEQLRRTQGVYDEIGGPSFKRLEAAVARIRKLREGEELPV